MKFSFPCAPVVSWEELAREQSISLASGFAFGFTTKPPLRSASGMLALLYRANGYTLEETASAMKCSVKKLRGLLDKARARFVTLYGEGGDE